MTRQRLFLDINCVDAARERMRHVYDTFDTVCVQFSGGKDSTAVLYLAKEIHEAEGSLIATWKPVLQKWGERVLAQLD